jgi:uncharacterized protein YutE (UPF0331/DUF86 family)/predicted nucleotidyltransferase
MNSWRHGKLAGVPKISKRESLESLRELLSKHDEVILAYLFGSTAEEGSSTHDIDLALKLESKNNFATIATLIGEIARTLKIPEDRVDIVDIDKAGLPLKHRIITQGIKLVNKKDTESALIRDIAENHPVYNMDYEYLCNLWLKEDPQIDRKLLLKRLDELLRNITMMKEKYVGRDASWLLKDLERAYAFERAIHRTIEAMLDICRHIVSTKRLGLAEYYSDYPLRIAEANLMDSQTATSISRLAKLRNILIHQYTELNYERLMDEAENLVNELSPKFTEWLRNFLSKEE